VRRLHDDGVYEVPFGKMLFRVDEPAVDQAVTAGTMRENFIWCAFPTELRCWSVKFTNMYLVKLRNRTRGSAFRLEALDQSSESCSNDRDLSTLYIQNT
jgi:hypothetical protein